MEEQTAAWLRNQKDPHEGGQMKVKKVHRVYDPDERGLMEILYIDHDSQPMTVWKRGRELVYISEGW